MRLPSASKLEAVERCPPSWTLDRISESSEAADDGTRRHAVLAARVAYLRGETVELVPPETKEESNWADVVLERHPWLAEYVTETAWALDAATGRGRLLGRNLGRHYDTTEGEVAGAADYLRVVEGIVEVVDLKTGQADVTPPGDNLQLAALAAAAASWHGVTRARVGILAAGDGRTPWVTWAELGPLDLLAVPVRMQRLRDDIVASRTKPRYAVGRWCGTCAARLSCPTQTAMLRRLAADPRSVAEDLAQGLVTPETAALAYQRFRAVKAALAQVETQLHAYAKEHGPIPVGDGRVWGPRESQRSVINPERAWLVLVEAFGVDGAREAMTLKTSKTAVSAVASSRAPRGRKGAAAKSLLAQLEAAGAVTTKTVTEFEEYMPQSVQPALAGAAGASPPPAAPVFSGPPDPDPNNGAETGGDGDPAQDGDS